MDVSLVIPAYNEEKYIGKLLDSAKRQTVPFKEIIVIDSGSKDATVRIASKYTKQIIVTMMRCVNHNRDVGIRSATSDIVCIVDADCILPRAYTENVIKCFDRDTSALVAPVYAVERNIFMKLMRGIQTTVLYVMSYISPVPFGANMIINRDKYIKVGGIPLLGCAFKEEVELYRRLSMCGDVKFCFGAYLYTSSRKFLCSKEHCNRLVYERAKECGCNA